MLAAVGVAMLGGVAVAATAQATKGDPNHKDYVCKYVSKPGEAERLQTGGNPIWVDTAATGLGWFNDAQGRSFVIRFNSPKLDPEPSISECPAPSNSVPVLPPAYTPPTCDAPSTIIGPVETDYYKWVLNNAGDTYTAVPKTVGDSDVHYTLTGVKAFPVTKGQPDTSQCPGTITPTPPAYTPATCNAPSTIIGPVAGAHYTWALDESGKKWVAHAAEDYTLAEGDWSYPVTKGQPDTSLCPTTIVPPPVGPPPALVPPVAAPTVLGVVKDAPVAAPVVAGVVKDAPAVKTLAFTGAETVPLSLSGLLALLLGAALTVASRRQGGKEARE